MLLRTLSWTWLSYLACVVLAALLFGPENAPPGHRPGAFVALHLGLAVVAALGLVVARHASPTRQRVLGAASALVGLPVVFSSLGMILPHVNPPGDEWTWLAWDRALFGFDPTVAVQRWLAPWSIEVLQIAYASFYLQPILVLVVMLRRRAFVQFDAGLRAVVGGFLASYLGYVLFPTLPPYRFLDHGEPLVGLWLAGPLNQLLYEAELNRHDCFPSGHTMMALVAWGLAWRQSRRFALLLTPLTAATVFATVALRYHFVVDVVAGALAAVVTLWLTRPPAAAGADAEAAPAAAQTSW